MTAFAVAACLLAAVPLHAENEVTEPPVPATPNGKVPPERKIRGVDADNHLILLNKPGVISLVLGTNEDSQDAARAAGVAMYPFQGRPDFQLIVIVDLRDSLATWMPAVVLSQMRSNLDDEAVELKPWFVKNGNKGDPRQSSHVIPDFGGTICPQLGWPETSGNLRAVIFGADGREVKRWDKIDDMSALNADVRAAIKSLVDAEQARVTAVVKLGGTRGQPPRQHPPLLTDPPPPNSD